MQKILKNFIIFILLPLSLQANFIVKSYQELRNQKVIRQNYEESCGASALATLINLIDDNNLTELDLLKLMSQKELYTDMVSFADLEEAVKKLDFKNNSFLINRQILNELINIPILVKIESDPRYPHFVVIINHKGAFLQVLDPSFGEYISSKREFYSVWDKDNKGGYALIIVPKKELKTFTLNIPKALHFEFKPFSLY